MKHFSKSYATNIEASNVILLITLPICLGVAIQTNTTGEQYLVPFFIGIKAASIGGIVVGFFSSSHLSTNAPLAVLSVVATAFTKKSGIASAYELFLVTLILAGSIQIGMEQLKLSVISNYIPNSVIRGMLIAIGIMLVLKQLAQLIGKNNNNLFRLRKDTSFLNNQIIKKYLNTYLIILT